MSFEISENFTVKIFKQQKLYGQNIQTTLSCLSCIYDSIKKKCLHHVKIYGSSLFSTKISYFCQNRTDFDETVETISSQDMP